jgi:guanyl-specific ribonuclease Sa
MKTTAKLNLVLALALLISAVILVQACGDNNNAPDGSTLVVNPSAVTLRNVPTDATQNLSVIARYKDGTPIPYAKIHISGAFAEPFVPAQYQFYYYPEGTARPEGNRPVNSGFDGQTNENGVYNFSIVVYGGTAFDDTIYLNSGTANASVVLTVSAATTT